MDRSMMDDIKNLGGKMEMWQGQLFVRIPALGGNDKFWIVGFNFFGIDQLAQLLINCKEKDWQPFTDVINLKVNTDGLPRMLQEPGPGCPHHGTAKLKPSKKPNTMFCTAKMPNGSYCTYEEPS